MNPQEKRYQDELQRQAHMSIEDLLSSKEGRYEHAKRIAQTIIVLTIISGGMGYVISCFT
jgi:hypothetical protein